MVRRTTMKCCCFLLALKAEAAGTPVVIEERAEALHLERGRLDADAPEALQLHSGTVRVGQAAAAAAAGVRQCRRQLLVAVLA